MAITLAVHGVNAEPVATIDYAPRSFQPDTWKKRGTDGHMIPWTGKEVVFLTVPGEYDAELLATWVRRLDLGWNLYAELTGRRPQPLKHLDGKPTIAAVPGYEYTCGAGCGYVGFTGIELAMFYSHNYPALRKNPKAMPHYVFYEMGRNYYTFQDRHSCFTTGFAVFMRSICMDTLGFEDEDGKTRATIEGLEKRFSTSDLTFLQLFTNSADGEKTHRIRDAAGQPVIPSDQPCTYASAMHRLHRECGGNEWLKRFFLHLATAPEAKPDKQAGASLQCWYWFLSASIAARRDLSPIFADEWKLPIPPHVRQTLSETDWKSPTLDLPALLKSAPSL